MKIALLGAPGTGKTGLARALVSALQLRGHTARVLGPNEEGLPNCDFVIADTTALLAAVHRDIDPQDDSLKLSAIAEQAQFDLTLLTGLDLSPATTARQRQVDARLREVLQAYGLRYSVLYGAGDQRRTNALAAIDQWTSLGSNHFGVEHQRWQWVCDKCSDAQCEHQLFTSLLGSAPPNA
jgi:hypothetical protein